MSDDISIPGGPMQARSMNHSYRTRRNRPGGGGMQLMLIVAAGLGILLLGGLVVWSLMGHRSGDVPVVEADPRPVRVKPADPGGMQVVGANVEMGGTSVNGGGTMAPPPKRPPRKRSARSCRRPPHRSRPRPR